MPVPDTLELRRSCSRPCQSRGYQAKGTVIVRPSTSSTTRLSSFTSTAWSALLDFNCRSVHASALQEQVRGGLGPGGQLCSVRAAGTRPPFPKLRGSTRIRHELVPLDMHVRRLRGIQGRKENPVGADRKDGRHGETPVRVASAWPVPRDRPRLAYVEESSGVKGRMPIFAGILSVRRCTRWSQPLTGKTLVNFICRCRRGS